MSHSAARHHCSSQPPYTSTSKSGASESSSTTGSEYLETVFAIDDLKQWRCSAWTTSCCNCLLRPQVRQPLFCAGVAVCCGDLCLIWLCCMIARRRWAARAVAVQVLYRSLTRQLRSCGGQMHYFCLTATRTGCFSVSKRLWSTDCSARARFSTLEKVQVKLANTSSDAGMCSWIHLLVQCRG